MPHSTCTHFVCSETNAVAAHSFPLAHWPRAPHNLHPPRKNHLHCAQSCCSQLCHDLKIYIISHPEPHPSQQEQLQVPQTLTLPMTYKTGKWSVINTQCLTIAPPIIIESAIASKGLSPSSVWGFLEISYRLPARGATLNHVIFVNTFLWNPGNPRDLPFGLFKGTGNLLLGM